MIIQKLFQYADLQLKKHSLLSVLKTLNTVEVKSLHPPFRICKIVFYQNKRDNTKCMSLFI